MRNLVALGLRYVSEEEDQMRWQNAQVLALSQLQDRLCIHPGRKETESAKRVRQDGLMVDFARMVLMLEIYLVLNTSKGWRIG